MRAPTREDFDALPLAFDVPTAGRFFLLGREASYRAHHSGEFPVPVLKVGRRFIVTKSALGEALGIGDTGPPENGASRPQGTDGSPKGTRQARDGDDTGLSRLSIAEGGDAP